MKKMMVHFISLLILTSCGTSGLTSEQKSARYEEQVRTVVKALNDRHFMIEADYMTPRRGTGRHLDYGYSIEVRNDSLFSYLPYFGRAYNVPYGGGKGLNFSAPLTSYNSYLLKDHLYRIEMSVDNGEDLLNYVVEMYDTGQATIDVVGREREAISYTGQFAQSEKKN